MVAYPINFCYKECVAKQQYQHRLDLTQKRKEAGQTLIVDQVNKGAVVFIVGLCVDM